MPANDLDSFGRWLKQRREALDLTQKELAEATGCSLSTIRKMEAGLRRPSKQIAELLAACLEIEPADYEAFLRFAREGEAQANSDLAPATMQQNDAQDKNPASDNSSHAAAAVQPAQTRIEKSFSGATVPSNLPNYPTSFIGRQKNVEQVLGLLWRVDVRLLTIIGPPGIGKTRLAVEAVARLLDHFADGVYFVSLAPITDPTLLLPAIADALDLKQDGAKSLQAALAEFLRAKNMLLLLDNFEQVVEGATVIADLLRAAPRLKALATSRAPLDLYGEHEYTLAPLELPQPFTPNKVEQVQRYEAVQLFVRRAQAVNSDFRLTADNAAAVSEITRKLDGLPLAIELAAVRARHYEPETLLGLLNKSLDLLTGGPRDAPARHKTLRAAIAWSYDLLEPAEQKLFRSLGGFVGGFTAAAVEQVCGLGQRTAQDLLQVLVDKSLIVAQTTAGSEGYGQRFSMLETLREYALELLTASDENAEFFRRHALYCVEFAEKANEQLNGQEQKRWLDALDVDHANLLAALNFLRDLCAQPDATDSDKLLFLRLGQALGKYWYWRNRLNEGRYWLQQALAAQDESADPAQPDPDQREQMLLKADAFGHLGTLDWQQGDYNAAQQHYGAVLAISQQLDDKLHMAMALNNLGNIANVRGDFDTTRRFYEQSLAYVREMGNQGGIARLLNNLGVIAHKQEDFVAAARFSAEGLHIRRAIGDKANIAYSLSNLGWALHYQGDLQRAFALQEEAVKIGRELSSEAVLARTLPSLAAVALDLGDRLAARLYYAEALEIAVNSDTVFEIIGCLEGFSQLAVQHDWRLAALLKGAADAQRNAIEYMRSMAEQKRLEAALEPARTGLGAGAWQAAYDEGAKMDLEQALALALGQTAN